MPRKQRIEAYIDPHVVEELNEIDTPVSEFVRVAINEKLEGDE